MDWHAHIAAFESVSRVTQTFVAHLDGNEVHVVEGKIVCIVNGSKTAWIEDGKTVAITWDDGVVLRIGTEFTTMANLRERRDHECEMARREKARVVLRRMR
jgi:hypothetical protein